MNKLLFLFLIFLFLGVFSVNAVLFIPQGDIYGVGLRRIYNFTNISVNLFCDNSGNCATLTELNASGSASGDITAVNTDGRYLLGGASSGDVDLLLNDTELNASVNASIDLRVDIDYLRGFLDFIYVTFGFLDNNYFNKSQSDLRDKVINDSILWENSTGQLKSKSPQNINMQEKNINNVSNLTADVITSTSITNFQFVYSLENVLTGSSFFKVTAVDTGNLAVDGDGDRVAIPETILNDGDSFTVSFWAKPDSGNNGIEATVIDLEDFWIWVQVPSDGKPEATVTGSSGQELKATSSITTGTWDMVTITFKESPQNFTIYFNGVQEDSTTARNAIFSSTADGDGIGSWGTTSEPDREFSGNIDEVMIFDTDLTSAEISQIYDSGRNAGSYTGTSSGNLQAHYRFDDDTVDDDTANNNDGTIVNGAFVDSSSTISNIISTFSMHLLSDTIKLFFGADDNVSTSFNGSDHVDKSEIAGSNVRRVFENYTDFVVTNLVNCDTIDTTADGTLVCGDDTTIGNCSVDQSCDNVIYTTDKLGNTTSEITGLFSSGEGNITYSNGIFTLALLNLGEFNNNLNWITSSALIPYQLIVEAYSIINFTTDYTSQEAYDLDNFTTDYDERSPYNLSNFTNDYDARNPYNLDNFTGDHTEPSHYGLNVIVAGQNESDFKPTNCTNADTLESAIFTCGGTDKFSAFDGNSFTCTSDEGGGGGGAGDKWVDAGDWISPNSTFARIVNSSKFTADLGFNMTKTNIVGPVGSSINSSAFYDDGVNLLDKSNAINTTPNIENLGFTTGVHTTDSNASTACSGTTTYLDGEGTCDDISTVYVQASDWTTHDNYPTGCTNQFVVTIDDTLTCASVDSADIGSVLFSDLTNDIGAMTNDSDINVSKIIFELSCFDGLVCSVNETWNGSCLIRNTPTTQDKQGSAC